MEKAGKLVPTRVLAELTNSCNNQCVFCPRHTMQRKEGFMDWGLFKKVVDECRDIGVKKFQWFNFGEPLMHPKLFEAIDYVCNPEFGRFEQTVLSTNGISLTEEVSRKLLSSCIDVLNLSVNAYTKETYEKICGPYFEQVVENCSRIAALKKEMGVKKPVLQAQMTIFKENVNELPQFNQFWREKVDQVNFNHFEEFRQSGKFMRESGTVAGMNVVGERHYCNRLKRLECHVLWDGRLTICATDFDGELAVGNVKEKSIVELFNSEEINRIRKLHSEGKWDEIPICKTCTDWQW